MRVAVVVAVIASAAFNIGRLPSLALLPLVVGLLPFVVGKYLLCPLRWHAISASGQRRWWHLRVYAEGELLGMLTPAHSGADLWRAHQLHRVGLDRPAAVADVALDRLIGAVGLTVFVLAAGAALPPQLLVAALGIAAVALVGALLVRRHRPGLLAGRPRPPWRRVAAGLLLSLAYQVTVVGLLAGGLAATGHMVGPLALLGVFGASQIAAIIPGIPGAGPREGVLVAGLVALGVPLHAALGAVSVSAVIGWLPALALGGTLLLVRRVITRSTGPQLA